MPATSIPRLARLAFLLASCAALGCRDSVSPPPTHLSLDFSATTPIVVAGAHVAGLGTLRNLGSSGITLHTDGCSYAVELRDASGTVRQPVPDPLCNSFRYEFGLSNGGVSERIISGPVPSTIPPGEYEARAVLVAREGRFTSDPVTITVEPAR